MNIVVLSIMYPNSVIYRSGIFVHEQVKELKKFGNNIKVIAPIAHVPPLLKSINPKWRDYERLPKFEEIDGIEVYHPRFVALPGGYMKAYWGYYYSYSVGKTIKKILSKHHIDVLHGHGGLPDDHGTYLTSKKFNIPYLLTVHGATVYAERRRKSNFKKSTIAILNANEIIGVSNVIVDLVKDYTGRHHNISCIYNGYKPVDKKNDFVRRKSERLTVLFAGSLIERKGIRNLIRAFRKISDGYPNVDLKIAGGGILENEMKELVRTLKISDRVEFTGIISHDKMLKEIYDSDIFILPSWDEAFGVVYLEAMSMKKPVIGSLGEGISDIVKDGINGYLVDPKNIESISSKLEDLIEQPKLRDEFGIKGFESIQPLTWRENARQTQDLYKRVIGEV